MIDLKSNSCVFILRKIIFIGFSFCFFLSAKAQVVSNIRAEQRGQEIVVLYTLEATSTCEVNLLLSQDNGATWSAPLKIVSGDVGKNISAGEKQITWKVLEEQEYLVGDKMKFKVTANGRKSFEPEMVFVQGGTFKMGSKSGDHDERPVHSVYLNSFYIGKYEVTQAQWRDVMGSNPSRFVGCDKCPIENVSWNNTQEFLKKINALTGKNYRLPTEAEWEYAAKGGRMTMNFDFSGSKNLMSVAWYSENSKDKTHAVGLLQPNELVIYDMSGNVWEWCSDIYGIYHDSHLNNPIGYHSGEARVIRGGGLISNAAACRSTFRIWEYPEFKSEYYGFRLVLPVE